MKIFFWILASVILLLGASLRLFHLDRADVLTDEVFYGYRSIGLIDSLNSPFQPTPFEWYEKIPGWARWSFHDHPPLIFWLQHLFFKVFGVNLWGMRLPFALAGIAAVWLVFLIARKLGADQAAAAAGSLLLAVNTYHLWISRTGLQESMVIFLLLFSIWFFLRALEDTRWFYLAVIAAGLAILAKYTAVVLLPIFLTYLIWKRRDLLTWRRILGAGVLLLIILLPVIVYNAGLHRARGHFDYQFSYFLGQDVSEWQVRPGREQAGGFVQRFSNLFSVFGRGFGPIFSVLTLLAIFYLAKNFRRDQAKQFLVVVLGFLLLLFFAVGPQERFMPMLAPFLVIPIAAALRNFWQNRAKFFWLTVTALVSLELLYVANTLFTANPKGREVWTYSRLRRDSNFWGYNQLEKYLEEEMSEYYSALTFPVKFAFVKKLNAQAQAAAKAEGRKPRAVLFITDGTMYNTSSLWYVARHLVYDGWPMITAETYAAALHEDPEIFVKQGFEDFIFIKAGDTLKEPESNEAESLKLEAYLRQKRILPAVIKNPGGREAFRVYEFNP